MGIIDAVGGAVWENLRILTPIPVLGTITLSIQSILFSQARCGLRFGKEESFRTVECARHCVLLLQLLYIIPIVSSDMQYDVQSSNRLPLAVPSPPWISLSKAHAFRM